MYLVGSSFYGKRKGEVGRWRMEVGRYEFDVGSSARYGIGGDVVGVQVEQFLKECVCQVSTQAVAE